MKNILAGLLAGAGLIAGWVWYTQNATGFTEAELRRLEGQIVDEYRKRPSVSDVSAQMIRTASNAASGFAKFKVGDLQVQHTCTAQMEQSGNRYIWSCKP
jgi:Zn-dependent membrane protease YugP